MASTIKKAQQEIKQLKRERNELRSALILAKELLIDNPIPGALYYETMLIIERLTRKNTQK